MRLAAALVAAASCVCGAGAACTTFSSDAAPSDAGVDGPTTSDGASDSDGANDGDAAPCLNASCGAVIATNQANASELDVDKGLVGWTISGISGSVRTAPRGGGSVRDLAASEPRPKALQLTDSLVYFASGSGVHAVDRVDGGRSEAFAPDSGAPEVLSQRRVGPYLAFTRGTSLETCVVLAGRAGCNGASPASLDLRAEGRGIQAEPSGTLIWLYTLTSIHAASLAPLAIQTTWSVADVTSLAVDGSQVYFVKKGTNAIFANDSKASAAEGAKSLVTTTSAPTAITLGADFVYFAVADDGIVGKVPKAGGAAVIVASGLPGPGALAAQADVVFVALADGRIVSLPAAQ